MQTMKAYLPPLARLLMSSLFIWDGILQLRDPSGTAKYFANVHVPIPEVSVWISIVPSSRWIEHPSRFQDSVGGCSARRFLPRHRLWRSPGGRGLQQHDPFL